MILHGVQGDKLPLLPMATFNAESDNISLLPGQSEVQEIFCTDIPSQKAPPLRGAGFVQVRDLFCHPLPQRALQVDHSVHEDQPPFTATNI